MMQHAADALYDAIRAFGGWLQSIALLVIIGSGFLLLIGVSVHLRSPETFQRFAAWIRPRAAATFSWLFSLAMACLTGYILVEEHKMIDYRRSAEENSDYVSTATAPTNGIDQSGPAVAYLRSRTLKRELRLPSELAGRINSQGAQALSPYLQNGVTNASHINESFTRQGQDIVYTREVTLREEVPLIIDKAEVHANFQMHRDAKRTAYYECDFAGSYTFHNPMDQEVLGRFVFTPPDSATIDKLIVKVGDTQVNEPNQTGSYVWQGMIPPNAVEVATVRYSTVGGETFRYAIGSGRRRTGDFTFTLDSQSHPKFERDSIFPKTTKGTKSIWQLRDVITSQTISLAFPEDSSIRDATDGVLSLLPVALGYFYLWLTLRTVLGHPLAPTKILFALLSLGFGFASIPIILGYASVMWAVIAGAGLAIVLSGFSCGPRMVPGVALAGLTPLAMLSAENSSVYLLAVSVVSLISLVASRLVSKEAPA